MKNLFLITVVIIVISSYSFGQSTSEKSIGKGDTFTTNQLIKGWNVPGVSNRQDYDIYLDTMNYHSGNASGSIKSKLSGDNKGKTAFLMQTIKADNHRGKRLSMSAYVKSEDVEYSSIWMRLDGENMKVLGLDAMDNRPIKGTTDWQKYEIVLDIPSETQQIVFGINLKGIGQVWIDDIKFEDVGLSIPTTSGKSPAEWEKGSAKRIEQYKISNKEDYEKQLQSFLERNKTASLSPKNLDFEN